MKKCGKCDKTVYPTEELKCLDKTWHKGCFRCWECNMMLSMKNYKGYDKLPYCATHCPKPKHTQVADTPENARLAELSKQQSQVKYHEDFERTKGTKITIADDPETMRVKKTQGVVSQIQYHDHHNRAQAMEQNRALIDSGDHMPQNMGGRGHNDYQPAPEMAPPPPQQPQQPQPPQFQEQAKPSPYSARNQGQSTVYNAGGRGKVPEPETVEPAQAGRRVGSIADYDPMNDNYGSIGHQPQGYRQAQHHQPQQQHHQPQQQQQQQQQHHQQHQGYNQSYNQRAPPQQQQQQHHQPPQHQMAPPPQAQPQYHQPVRKEPDNYHHQPPPPAQPQQPQTPRYRAMYDYQAADTDEVSFLEGDVIVNVQQIDEGWMTGTVERTRQSGMLPANYVERG